MNETTQGARFDEAKLKDLTGGDTLTARFLHQEFFDFHATHRIVIRGNHKPTINGTDEGIWRRLRLVPFTVSIPPDEQDRDLIHKLESELPGILNWALQGCREWQSEGLKPPSIIADAVRAYREESDILGRFIEECCEVRKLAQVKSSALFKRYQEFAEAAGERWIPAKDFPTEMQRRGFSYKRGTGGTRLFHGIELQSEGSTWAGSGVSPSPATTGPKAGNDKAKIAASERTLASDHQIRSPMRCSSGTRKASTDRHRSRQTQQIDPVTAKYCGCARNGLRHCTLK
jgi:putative DNA primase/helicase